MIAVSINIKSIFRGPMLFILFYYNFIGGLSEIGPGHWR